MGVLYLTMDRTRRLVDAVPVPDPFVQRRCRTERLAAGGTGVTA